MYTYIMPTSAGKLLIRGGCEAVTEIFFCGGDAVGDAGAPPEPVRMAAGQLAEYFARRRQILDFPIKYTGTAFQRRVWEALKAIPYGQTRTYAQIAASVGSPKGARAVGMACNRNPLAIIIPCHRVVGSGGALTGYAGGVDKKAALLELEKGQRNTG